MAGLSPADIAIPIRSVLERQGNAQVVLGDATRIDLERRCVLLEQSGEVAYDFLIVAIGAKTNYFGHGDWAKAALGLKTIDDALAIRRRVLLAFEAAEREDDPEVRRRLLTFVVIGGGPTGVEVAGALTELGRFGLAGDFRRIRNERVRVVLIEAEGRLLAGGFDASLATSAKADLEHLGVEVRLSSRVTGIDSRAASISTESASIRRPCCGRPACEQNR